MTDRIPRVDLDNYELDKSIGEGNYASVYLVIDKKTNKKYAAKVFKNDEEINDFEKEIALLSTVQNHAILKIYGYSPVDFEGHNHPVLIMEYMENSSLDKALKTLTKKQKYIVLLGVSIGMKSLHMQSIIHRNLKPGNILLDSNFHPKICDIGISFISDLALSQVLMNAPIGTPLYEAPEILNDEPYSYKIDVYSFSLIAYELITNERPYKEIKGIFKLQSAIIEGKRPDTEKIEDPQMKNFIKKCWSPVPKDRPSFDIIVEEVLNEKYQEFFGVSKEEVEDYLSNFPEELRP